MLKTLTNYISIACLLTLLSCEQTEMPEVFVGEPVFFLKLDVEGNTETLIAGEEGYYMFTNVDQGLNSTTMNGTLSHVTQPAEFPSISIEISNELLYPAASHEELLPEGEYNIDRDFGNQLFQLVSFDNQSLGEGNIDYFWDLG